MDGLDVYNVISDIVGASIAIIDEEIVKKAHISISVDKDNVAIITNIYLEENHNANS